MSETKLFIFDLDGTLTDCAHRMHNILSSPKKWDAFFAACSDDPPIEWVCNIARLIRTFECGKILILSGRSFGYVVQTKKWLRLNLVPYDHLVMRKEKDFRPDIVAKPELLEEFLHFKPGFVVQWIIEDRPQMVEKWRSIQFNVLDVGVDANALKVSTLMEAGEHAK